MNKVSRLMIGIVTLAMLVAFSLAGSGGALAQGQPPAKPPQPTPLGPGRDPAVAPRHAPATAPAVGPWTPLVNQPPTGGLKTCLLLSDGTVMCLDSGTATDWYRLTPDINGSYVNGTWTQLASMSYSRVFFQSQVLRDGRVFVSGGEYGTGGNTAEIFDPISNHWTEVQSPANVYQSSILADGSSEVLPNGNVLVFPQYADGYINFHLSLIFDIVSETWSVGPDLQTSVAEANWVKLADDSILTLNLFDWQGSQRYIPSLNQWIADSVLPETIWNTGGLEYGPSVLLPNGKAFALGGNGKTALYTPSATTSPGTWAIGALPADHGANDAPAAMMPNGKILAALGPVNAFGGTDFYEYDYVANAFTPVSSPTGGTHYDYPTYAETFLDLPDGSILFNGGSLYVYKPAGKPLPKGKPVIQTVAKNPDGSYHLTGTLFNGISEGAYYGDDYQMNTNYPIARLKDRFGHVYYGRTFNWSDTGVMTGNKKVSTEMTLPAGLPAGNYSLTISANGISSGDYDLTIR